MYRSNPVAFLEAITKLSEIGVEGNNAPWALACEIIEGIGVGILTEVPSTEFGLETFEAGVGFGPMELLELDAVLLKPFEIVRSSAIASAKNAGLRRIIISKTD